MVGGTVVVWAIAGRHQSGTTGLSVLRSHSFDVDYLACAYRLGCVDPTILAVVSRLAFLLDQILDHCKKFASFASVI
jgi:hypothetical protein